ncbi:hypothetical protein AAHE18_09G180500 [Arachis hypogaea]|nr:Cysteine-rich receptor-like protein kinase [Arachis hypogaea]
MHKNLHTLFSTLASDTKIDYGFYNLSYGQNDDKVNAVGLCQGDLNQSDCRRCLNDSRIILPKHCPNQKEAVGWYDQCMLQYSNRTIFGSGYVDNTPMQYLINMDNATDVEVFKQERASLMSNLRNNCTPDLSSQKCDECLEGIVDVTLNDGKKGGRVLTPRCHIRFETYRFFQFQPTTTTNNNTTTSKSRSVIVVAVPSVTVLVFIMCSICVYLKVKRPSKLSESTYVEEEITINESLQFDFDTIRVATSDFSNSNKLGQGGFGAVYKGQLSNGQMIAVKRLSKDSGQGATEFKNEVLLLVKLQHRNLVKFLGFCLEGIERLLIYEFVPKKSLDYFIFDPIKRRQLNWTSRYKIIKGVARALLYLHEDSRFRIIHRDLKTSNILLDDDMNPKIADFGLAKLFGTDQTQGNTNQIVGIYFGVIVLEIVSGKRHIENGSEESIEQLLSFVWRNWKERTAINIIDPSLSNISPNEVMRCVHIGLLCVQEDLAHRPNMSSIVLMLDSCSVTMPTPSEPAFFLGTTRTRSLPLSDIHSAENNTTTRTSESTSKSAQESENEASVTELYPR